jgi:S-adenosylmethionine synthetase
VAGAFVDRYLSNLDDYLAGKERIAGLARAAAARMSRLPVTVDVNAADDPG